MWAPIISGSGISHEGTSGVNRGSNGKMSRTVLIRKHLVEAAALRAIKIVANSIRIRTEAFAASDRISGNPGITIIML